jgi:hypothetical protein
LNPRAARKQCGVLNPVGVHQRASARIKKAKPLRLGQFGRL